MTARDLTAGINTAEERIRAAVPIAETIYLEPDLYHPEEADTATLLSSLMVGPYE